MEGPKVGCACLSFLSVRQELCFRSAARSCRVESGDENTSSLLLSNEQIFYRKGACEHNSSSQLPSTNCLPKMDLLISHLLKEEMLGWYIDWNRLSDHEVLIAFLSLNDTSALRMWSLDNSCRKVSEFRDYLRQQISFYLELNEASGPLPLALCAGLKAFIKGQIILNTMRRKKDLCWQDEIWKEQLRTFKGSTLCLEILPHRSFSNWGEHGG